MSNAMVEFCTMVGMFVFAVIGAMVLIGLFVLALYWLVLCIQMSGDWMRNRRASRRVSGGRFAAVEGWTP